MTDRELIEAAAKAAGVYLAPEWRGHHKHLPDWNPLEDDGDALRLAVALLLDVRHVHGKAHAGMQDEFWCTEAWFPNGAPAAATRRAITRAAAALAGTATGEKP